MGWTSETGITLSELVDDMTSSKDYLGECRCLAHAVLARRNEGAEAGVKYYVLYRALEGGSGTSFQGETIACITLIDVEKNRISWKEMDETCGVECFSCPKSILDLLTPTKNSLAWLWREFCKNRFPREIGYPSAYIPETNSFREYSVEQTRQWAAEQAAKVKAKRKADAAKTGEKLFDGAYIRLKDGLFVKHSDGLKYTRLKVAEAQKRRFVLVTDDGYEVAHYRLSGINHQQIAEVSSDMRDIFPNLLPSIRRELDEKDKRRSQEEQPQIKPHKQLDLFGGLYDGDDSLATAA